MRRIIAIFVVLCALSAAPAYPYWIWTPKSGKWVNPKNMPKPTPKEQFDFAKGFYDQNKYEDAIREFKKLLNKYPKSAEASESQYYLGLIEEAQGNLYEAYKAYQRVIDKYPFSERIQEIIEREYKIAESFIAGQKRKVLGVALPVENPAIEILNKVIENSSYGPKAAVAQYKLGLVLKGLLRYSEAEDAFNKVITNYPNSEWVEAAKFQIASCEASVSQGPEYDQGIAKDAKDKFEEFVKEHPDAALSKAAQENIDKLMDAELENAYNIARFYEKQKAYEAAKIYYEDVIIKSPDSKWAKKALENLEIMEKKK